MRLKKRQLGPNNNFHFFACNCLFKKCVETPTFIVFWGNRCFRKTNLDQIITSKTPKLGPDNNSTAICCEVIIWSKFGVFGSYYLVQVGFLEVIIWSKFVFLAYKIVVYLFFFSLSLSVSLSPLSLSLLSLSFFLSLSLSLYISPACLCDLVRRQILNKKAGEIANFWVDKSAKNSLMECFSGQHQGEAIFTSARIDYIHKPWGGGEFSSWNFIFQLHNICFWKYLPEKIQRNYMENMYWRWLPEKPNFSYIMII